MSKWGDVLLRVAGVLFVLFALIVILVISDDVQDRKSLPSADGLTVAAIQLADGRGTVLRIVDLGGYRLAIAYNKVGGMSVVELQGKPEEP